MLVMSRRLSESIYIGSNIVVTVVSVDRGRVRLGVSCPREVPVNREELLSYVEQDAIRKAANFGHQTRPKQQPATPAG